MARRHTSGFDILGFDSDPTPGDPDVILNQIIPTYTSLGDDAQSAFDALRGNAMADGKGKTMDALRKVIGSKYPPKLQQTADSFHGAAQVYRTYAQSLSDAQSQLDKAMDQAQQVAGAAAQTVPPLPADATPEQQGAAKSQQQGIDQANADLTAAKRLGQDAKDLRDQAGHTFNKNLGDVSTVPERSFFQKFLDFFEHNPLIKILIDVAIAITTVFFPVVGLALGAAAFLGTTVLDTISTGHFDVGSFVAGLAGLALGGLGVAAKFLPAVAKGFEAANTFGKGIPGIGKLIFESSPNVAAKGLGDLAKQVGKNFGKGFAIQGGLSAVTGVAATGINDALTGKKFTGLQAAEIFAGAAAAGVIGGGLKVGDGAIFKDPLPVGSEKPLPGLPTDKPLPGLPTDKPLPDKPLPGLPTDKPLPDKPLPGLPTDKPLPGLPTDKPLPDKPLPGLPADADRPLPGLPTDKPLPDKPLPGLPIDKPLPDKPLPGLPTDKPLPGLPTDKPLPDKPLPGLPIDKPLPDTPPFSHEGTLGRQGFDAANGVIQNVGSHSAQAGIDAGLDPLGENDKNQDDADTDTADAIAHGDPGTAVADGATDSLPGSASSASSGAGIRQIFGGPGHRR